MEQISDSEDFVPPTPKNQRGNINSLISKPISKIQKRKKVSGVSPDFKKIKNKSKQVTIFSYLTNSKKTADNPAIENKSSLRNQDEKILIDKLDSSNTSSTSNVTECSGNNTDNWEDFKPVSNKFVRTNLMKKFENSNPFIKNSTKCSRINGLFSPTKSVNNKLDYSDIKPEDTNNIDSVSCEQFSEMIAAHELNGMQTIKTDLNLVNNTSQPHSISSNDAAKARVNLDLLVSGFNICTDVENLKLDGNNCDHSNYNNVPKDNSQVVNNLDDLFPKEEKAFSSEDSFAWMSDLDWKSDSFIGDDDSSKSQMPEDVPNTSKANSILFKVKEVCRTSIANEVKLVLKASDSQLKTCILRGFWTDSLVNSGDIVHVINKFENNLSVIDDQTGFLVVNPDFLLSSTAIVSTLFCMRKAVLNHILPSWASGNKLMMIGNLVHDIFQQSVNSHASTAEEINKIVESVLTKRENLLSLSCQETPYSEMELKLKEYVPSIIQWIKRHVALKGMVASENLQVTCVEGIEDNVWCPKYGIKGKIDMTVKALFRDKKTTKLLPLELKTGRPTFSAEHTGQINLYTLMMDERTKEVAEGLLLYLKDASNMKVVTANHNSRRGLIQLRNELAFYTYKWFSSSQSQTEDIEHCHLPSPINSKKMCQKCPYILPCTVYQRAFAENKSLDPDHAMVSLISSTTSHLTASHLEYFIHWSNLLLLESTTSTVSNAFWTEDAVIREKKGTCLSWMSLQKCLPIKELEEKYFVHVFIRRSTSSVSEGLLTAGLRKGDYVAVSNQDNLDEVAISMGYIFEISDSFVEVGMDRNLCLVSRYNTYTYRIDKQVSNSAAACIRNNLMLLMSNDDQAERLRLLIIEKQAPKFVSSLPKNVVLLGRPILKVLNKIQQKAILKSLMAEDYFLIKGMPGTGKTSTIVALVRLFVKMGLSVFLTSYTHSAIDNILLKLKEHIPFVRIGQEARIHPGVKEFSFQSLTKDFKTVEQFKTFMDKEMVVATTCLGVNHPIFSIRKFDFCIVDEASQINQISCLGPLFHANKFILVGDDKQLPPLVINEKAKNKGMEESLFQSLSNPSNCIELVIQYRMNEEIMKICNEITYGGILQCGSENIAKAVLHFKDSDSILKQTPAWLFTVLSCDLVKSVVFVNTDEITLSFENGQGQEISDFEANIVDLILKSLLERNIQSSDVGIISPYRKQVDLIKRKIMNYEKSDIEVNTVDQYQGRDKDIIIISCVKCGEISADSTKKRSILNDEKRLNVAITRARKKLIIIGCKKSLICYKPFKNIISCLRKEQILNLLKQDFPP